MGSPVMNKKLLFYEKSEQDSFPYWFVKMLYFHIQEI